MSVIGYSSLAATAGSIPSAWTRDACTGRMESGARSASVRDDYRRSQALRWYAVCSGIVRAGTGWQDAKSETSSRSTSHRINNVPLIFSGGKTRHATLLHSAGRIFGRHRYLILEFSPRQVHQREILKEDDSHLLKHFEISGMLNRPNLSYWLPSEASLISYSKLACAARFMLSSD